MAATSSTFHKVAQHISLAWRNLLSLRKHDMRQALTGRNATIAYGAAIVVVLIWIFGGGDVLQKTTSDLLEKYAPPQSSIVVQQSDDEAGKRHAAVDPSRDGQDRPRTGDDPKADGEAAPIIKPTDNPQYQESVEVDVSAKSVAITAGFSGQRIVVFGAVHKSLQISAEQELYDVIVVLEGTKAPLVTRRKSNVGGLWINTDSLKFARVPSYYTISSTRPIRQISTPIVFDAYSIGFEHVRMDVADGKKTDFSEAELRKFRDAIIRLKAKEGLYQKKEDGVTFIGSALFRTSIDLPANVPIGNVIARTYLFRDAELIAQNTVTVALERQGIEAILHDFAFDYPLLYGIFAVLVAVSAGLAASAAFNRGK